MISYSVYKVVHLFAVILLFVAIGGIAVHAANGGDRSSNRVRKLLAAMHGLGLLLILVTGFGALARLEMGFAGWVGGKLAIWLLLAILALLPYRKQKLGKPFLILLPILGGAAAFLAIVKPF